MQSFLVLVLVSSLLVPAIAADKSDVRTSDPVAEEPKEKEESVLKVVPLITSSPLLGTGVGAALSYLYRADEDSSKSQLRVGGQYSDTESYNVFFNNNLFFGNNKYLSATLGSYSSVNNEFPAEEGGDVEYNVESYDQRERRVHLRDAESSILRPASSRCGLFTHTPTKVV